MNTFANIKTITKRELGAYFSSPLAYVFLVIFLLLCGFFTFFVDSGMGTYFKRDDASLVTFFVCPSSARRHTPVSRSHT